MDKTIIAAKSVIAVDIGSTITRSLFFDVVSGKYRFVAVGSAPTTAGVPHFDVTEGIKNHIEDKIEKFEKYLKKIMEIHVILSIEHERQMAEIILSGSEIKLLGKEESGDMYSSIDAAANKIEHQLRDRKERLKHHKENLSKKTRSYSKMKSKFR